MLSSADPNHSVCVGGGSVSLSQRSDEALFVLQYLVEAQVVLDGVRGVEDGPAGGDNQDKAVEGLRVKHTDS